MTKIKAMKPEEDAFGQYLWACYKGRKSVEVLERDDGYIDASPSLHSVRVFWIFNLAFSKLRGRARAKAFSEYKDWHLHEKRAMEFVKGRVLDIGCGAGRHSLYLQKKGFDVLGIDNSPLAIKVCKLRELKKAEVMSIEDVNFKPNSFDTIIMMWDNFGLFGSFKKARKLLKKFHKMTSENALIIAETRDPYKTSNPAHLEYQEFNRKRGRMSGQWRIRIRFGKYATRWFDYLRVSKEEMEEILNGTGWKVKKFIDSEENASIYIAIIEKVID